VFLTLLEQASIHIVKSTNKHDKNLVGKSVKISYTYCYMNLVVNFSVSKNTVEHETQLKV